MGWILLHVTRYWEITTFVHMEGITNQQTSNAKGRRPVHQGKKTKNNQGVPTFSMDPHNSNHIKRRQQIHIC